MKVYIKVSKDKYELIEELADTEEGLAELCGVGFNTIHRAIALSRQDPSIRVRYREVEIDDVVTPEELYEWRMRNGYTLEQIAAEIGTSTFAVGSWERGEHKPRTRYQMELERIMAEGIGEPTPALAIRQCGLWGCGNCGELIKYGVERCPKCKRRIIFNVNRRKDVRDNKRG